MIQTTHFLSKYLSVNNNTTIYPRYRHQYSCRLIYRHPCVCISNLSSRRSNQCVSPNRANPNRTTYLPKESLIPNFSVPIAPESPELCNQPIQQLTFVPTKLKPTMAGTQGQPSTATQQQPPPIIVSIPMRGERGAPTVDINKPRMLI